ncbi:MAG: MFS transporter [Actinobacteria bacterium]|nr:MAG: MFS transporter [Actinomycetota bacterium]
MRSSNPRRWIALLVLCPSLMVIGIDNTILNVALPTLVRDLHASNSQLQWIVDSYILVFAGLLLTAGSLGDRFGRRGALSVGLALFGASSAAAAFASSANEHGFTEPKERGRAIGIWAGVAGIGIAVGPILGGALLGRFWWGSIFLVNVPVAFGALILGRFFLPTSKDPSAPRLDPIGAALSMAALSALLWAIIGAPARGWASAGTLGFLLLAFAVLGLFAAWELHTDHPMLDVSFFRNPRFTVASLAITSGFFAISGALFLVTQLLQSVMGYNTLQAGLRIAPIAVVLIIGGPLSPRLVERFGTKRMVAFGLCTAACGLVLLGSVGIDSPYLLVLGGLVTMALGMSMTMAPATESIMGSLPREKAGVGSAVNDTTRQTGGALGVAVLGSILASGYQSHLHVSLRGADAVTARSSVGAAVQLGERISGRVGHTVIDVARSAYVHGMHLSFLVGAAILVCGAVLAIAFLPARAPYRELDATEYLPTDIVVDPSQLAPSGVVE